MSKLAIGIDIGGTNTKFGFADEHGNILIQSRIKTAQFSEYTQIIPALKSQLEALHSFDEVVGIGIGAPNANFYEGTIVDPPNLPWKGISHFTNEMEKVFDKKCVITNDANASALGEMVYGHARGMKNFVVLTVGTGLGSGVVVNGELMYGHNGFAAELGHTLVNINGRNCGCGRKGCLETYVSATGIRRTVYKMLADYTEESPLRSISFNDLSTKMITEAAQHGDKIAIECFKYTGRILGMKLADFVVHTDPEAIFIMGGLSKAGDHFFNPVRENMYNFLMPVFKKFEVKLQPSGLKDDDAPILGASSLVWKYLDKQ